MGRVAWFPKFVIAPLVASALGFWLIGPRLAGNKELQKVIQEKAAVLLPHSKSPESSMEGKTESMAPDSPAPQVRVDVKPVSDRLTISNDEKPKRKRKRRRVRHKASSVQKKTESPRRDSPSTTPDPASTPGG